MHGFNAEFCDKQAGFWRLHSGKNAPSVCQGFFLVKEKFWFTFPAILVASVFFSVPDLNLTTTDPAKYHFLIRLNALASSKKAFPAFWAVLSAAPA